jgi:hypothetical protein
LPVLQGPCRLTTASDGEVAGRGPSPLPPWPSPVTGLAFEVFPRRLPRIEQFVRCDRLLRLGSPTELSLRAGSVTLLSWDSSACASPPTCRSDVHSQEPLPAPFGQVLPRTRSRSASAVSHRPDGLLHPTVAGLLHPATGQRFTAFPAARGQHPSEDGSEPSGHSPRCGFTPLEGSPSSAAVPRHRGRCPPVVDTRSTPRHDRSVPTPGVPPRLPSFRGHGWHPSSSSFPRGFEPESSSPWSALLDPIHPDSGSMPQLPEQPRPRTGGGSVASAARDLSSPQGRLEVHAKTRVHAIAATRWLAHSVDAIPSPSFRRRASPGSLRAEARERPSHRSGPARVVPTRRGGGWHLVRCLRVERRALSMMVMLRSTEVDPHVTTTTPRPDLSRISCASPRDSGHRGGCSGMNRRSWAPRLRSLFACLPRIGVVPRLRSPDRPSVPFSNNALPSPGDPSPPTWVEVDLRWTRVRRPLRIASHERLRRSHRSSPTPEPPEECPTPGLCSADESVTSPDRCRSANALSFHGLISPPRSTTARRFDDVDVCSAP